MNVGLNARFLNKQRFKHLLSKITQCSDSSISIILETCIIINKLKYSKINRNDLASQMIYQTRFRFVHCLNLFDSS